MIARRSAFTLVVSRSILREIAPHLGLGSLKCTIPSSLTVLYSNLITAACIVLCHDEIDAFLLVFLLI